MKIDWNRKYTTIAVYAVIVFAVSALITLGSLYLKSIGSSMSSILGLIKPLIYGFVFAYLLCPLLNLLEKKAFRFMNQKKPHRKLTRIFSLILTYVIILVLLGLFFYVMIPQIVESFNGLTKKMNDYLPAAQNYVVNLFHSSSFFQDQIVRLEDSITGLLTKSFDLVQKLIPYITKYATGLVVETSNALVGIIISVYFLASKEKLLAQTRKLTNAIFGKTAVHHIYHVAELSHRTFGGFIVGKIVDSTIIGILCLIICLTFRIAYAPLISLIIGVTNVIPFFGPLFGAIPAAFIVFIAKPEQTILFIIIVLLLQQLDGNVIGPWILGDSIGLSAMWVVIAITVSSSLFGIFGLFLGVPTFGVFYVLIKELTEKKLKKRGLETDTLSYYSDPEDAVLYEKKQRKKPRFMQILIASGQKFKRRK